MISELDSEQRKLKKDITSISVLSSRIGYDIPLSSLWGMTLEDRNLLVEVVNDELIARSK